MSEPIKSRCELNKAEEGRGEFFVVRGDAAVDFDTAEEVLDLMA